MSGDSPNLLDRFKCKIEARARHRTQPLSLTSPQVAPNLGESSYSGQLNGRTGVQQMTDTKPGRERRKAWIYSVINPLLEGLRIEATFLARENWTFRRYNRELEFIRPVPILVGHVSLPNLEDLENSKPDTQKVIERREAQREKLRDACRAAFDTLAANPDFQRKVSDALQVWKAKTLVTLPSSCILLYRSMKSWRSRS